MFFNQGFLSLVFEVFETLGRWLTKHEDRDIELLGEDVCFKSALVSLDERVIQEKVQFHDEIDYHHIFVSIESSSLEF